MWTSRRVRVALYGFLDDWIIRLPQPDLRFAAA